MTNARCLNVAVLDNVGLLQVQQTGRRVAAALRLLLDDHGLDLWLGVLPHLLAGEKVSPAGVSRIWLEGGWGS